MSGRGLFYKKEVTASFVRGNTDFKKNVKEAY